MLILGVAVVAAPWRLASAQQRSFEGTYTIVNKANGRRMLSNTKVGLFVIEDSEPVYSDQMWLLAPQDNNSFALVNAANGMRVLAQSGYDWEQGFFAVDYGPVYQDQRWSLDLQQDGSYVIANVKSGRRILARLDGQGRVNFAAVASSNSGAGAADVTARRLLPPRSRGASTDAAERANSPSTIASLAAVAADETWWLINQERDDTARFLLQLQRERRQHAKAVLEEAAAAAERAAAVSEAAVVAAQQNATACAAALAVAVESTQESPRGKDRVPFRAEHEEQVPLRTVAPSTVVGGNDCGSRCSRDQQLLAVAFALVVVCLALCCRRHVHLSAEVTRQQKHVAQLEQELQNEFGGVVKVGDTVGELGRDFSFQVFSTELNEEKVRLIKIQCPGVEHSDVEVGLIFNGCEVTIQRRPSRGVEATLWRRRFQFRPSDGNFEFKEDQMQLESGFLQLVFRSYPFQRRVIRFPQHFSLAATDADTAWEYASDGASARQGDDVVGDERREALRAAAECGEVSVLVDADTVSTASTTPAR